MGCKYEYKEPGFSKIICDKHGRTSLNEVFVIGDGAKIGGAQVASYEGHITANIILKDFELTKDEYVVEFIKAFKAIEDEMEPYKQHKRDIRKNYVQNGWLTKNDMRQAVRAYRMVEQGDNIDQFTEYFDKINKKVTGI